MAIDEKKYKEFEETLEELVGETLTKINSLSHTYPDMPQFSNKPYHIYSNPEGINYLPLIWLTLGLHEPYSGKTYYTLGIIGTWHILKNAKSVCAYVGAYDRDSELLENLKLIENQTVNRVVFIREKLNLFIEFANQYWRGIFHKKNQVSGFEFTTIRNQFDGRSGSGAIWEVVNGEIGKGWWIS